MMPNAVQVGEYSMTGGVRERNWMTGIDGIVRTWSDPNGKLNVLVVNWNGSQRKLNCNWFDNTWNRQNYRFAGRRPRNFLHFSLRSGGVEFFRICPCHPPSILPTSSIRWESAAYFFVSSDFVSHKIIKSNLSVSILRVASRTYGIFSSRERNAAAETASIDSIYNSSILPPSEYRWIFGSVEWYSCHKM